MASGKNHSSRHCGTRQANQLRGWLIVWLLGAMLQVACGYRFRVGQARLADGSQELSIPMAENLTSDAQAGFWLTVALRREAQRVGLKVCQPTSSAAGLHAKLVSIQSVPRGVAVFGGKFRTREQEVVVEVVLDLRLSSDKPVRVSLGARESYLSAPDVRGTETNRQVALKRALDRVARDGLDRLARDF